MIKCSSSSFQAKACIYQAIQLQNHIISIFNLHPRLYNILIMIKHFTVMQRHLNNQLELPIQLLNIYPSGSQMWSPEQEH